MKTKIKSIVNFTKSIFIVLTILFISIFLYENRDVYHNLKLNYDFSLILLSLFTLMLYTFCNLTIWFYITQKNKCAISFKKTIVLRLYSELGKYIPGKIWGYGMLFLYYDKEGKSKKSISICSFYELISSVLGAVSIFIFSLIFIDNELINNYKYIAYLFLLAFLIIIHPRIIQFAVNKVFVFIKREPVLINLSYIDILKLIILYTINWLIFGLAFFIFINSFYKLSISNFFFLTGSFSLSSLIGFFALFAPAGLGVREGILILTLKNIVSVPIAGIISIASRIWITFGELIFILILFTYDKIKKVL